MWIKIGEVKSDRGSIYSISWSLQNEKRVFSCTCPHWQNRLYKVKGECRHIKAFRAEFGDAYIKDMVFDNHFLYAEMEEVGL